jgi:hypothetical protein
MWKVEINTRWKRILQYNEDSQAPICLVNISADFSQLVINKMPPQNALVCAKRR